jgi:hypothetical protein
MRASATSFKYFNIGVMGAVEPRYNRIVMPVDFMWMKLSDDRGLPFDEGATSVKAKMTETLLTPKIGYRFADTKRVKVDALFGYAVPQQRVQQYARIDGQIFPNDQVHDVYRYRSQLPRQRSSGPEDPLVCTFASFQGYGQPVHRRRFVSVIPGC